MFSFKTRKIKCKSLDLIASSSWFYNYFYCVESFTVAVETFYFHRVFRLKRAIHIYKQYYWYRIQAKYNPKCIFIWKEQSRIRLSMYVEIFLFVIYGFMFINNLTNVFNVFRYVIFIAFCYRWLFFNDILETRPLRRLMLVCNLTHIGCLVMFDTQFPNVLHQCLLWYWSNLKR